MDGEAKVSTGFPIVLSAASGTGKTTLGQRLMRDCPGLTLSVSFTTRAPRAGEVDGADYHFIDTKRFDDMVRANAFIEWAEVHGNLYGTAFSEVQNRLDQGQDVLLDIDVQGGKQIRDRFKESLLIFLLPPSLGELRRRLESRGTEAPDDFHRRMLNARREIEAATWYDYLIVNDHLDRAAATLCEVVKVERIRRLDKLALISEIVAGA